MPKFKVSKIKPISSSPSVSIQGEALEGNTLKGQQIILPCNSSFSISLEVFDIKKLEESENKFNLILKFKNQDEKQIVLGLGIAIGEILNIE